MTIIRYEGGGIDESIFDGIKMFDEDDNYTDDDDDDVDDDINDLVGHLGGLAPIGRLLHSTPRLPHPDKAKLNNGK